MKVVHIEKLSGRKNTFQKNFYDADTNQSVYMYVNTRVGRTIVQLWLSADLGRLLLRTEH